MLKPDPGGLTRIHTYPPQSAAWELKGGTVSPLTLLHAEINVDDVSDPTPCPGLGSDKSRAHSECFLTCSSLEAALTGCPAFHAEMNLIFLVSILCHYTLPRGALIGLGSHLGKAAFV